MPEVFSDAAPVPDPANRPGNLLFREKAAGAISVIFPLLPPTLRSVGVLFAPALL